MDYYQLSQHNRWLEKDSPYNIGGRETDISEIGYSLMKRVMVATGNSNDLRNRLISLNRKLEECEKEVQSIISDVSDQVHDTSLSYLKPEDIVATTKQLHDDLNVYIDNDIEEELTDDEIWKEIMKGLEEDDPGYEPKWWKEKEQ